MKELVELIAKSLVDNPGKVQVSQLDGEQSSIIELKVAPEDLGKVIRKQGRTAQAIRVILGAAETFTSLNIKYHISLAKGAPKLRVNPAPVNTVLSLVLVCLGIDTLNCVFTRKKGQKECRGSDSNRHVG